jgi:hypothetical protein
LGFGLAGLGLVFLVAILVGCWLLFGAVGFLGLLGLGLFFFLVAILVGCWLLFGAVGFKWNWACCPTDLLGLFSSCLLANLLGSVLLKKNYVVWEFQFKLFVMGKELWGHIDGSDPTPTETKDLAKWMIKDARVVS